MNNLDKFISGSRILAVIVALASTSTAKAQDAPVSEVFCRDHTHSALGDPYLINADLARQHLELLKVLGQVPPDCSYECPDEALSGDAYALMVLRKQVGAAKVALTKNPALESSTCLQQLNSGYDTFIGGVNLLILTHGSVESFVYIDSRRMSIAFRIYLTSAVEADLSKGLVVYNKIAATDPVIKEMPVYPQNVSLEQLRSMDSQSVLAIWLTAQQFVERSSEKDPSIKDIRVFMGHLEETIKIANTMFPHNTRGSHIQESE